MKATQRRKDLVNIMLSEKQAVSGGRLSEMLGVSRQIIVRDISALKDEGFDILSTHNGYIINETPLKERVFKVYHTREQTENELTLIVDFGGTVADVFVWHKVYGRMSAPLNIASRHHITQFLEGVRSGKSSELMNITGGYHYHTVRAETEATLDIIENALKAQNYIVPEI